MAKRWIYLLRHGQAGQEPKAPGDPPLTPLGIEQVRLTARRLRQLPLTSLHTSTLRRAEETAAQIAHYFPHLPLKRHHNLRECIPCVPPKFADYFAETPVEALGRDQDQAARAFNQFFRGARGRDQHDLLVCHGNLIRYLLCRALEAPPESWANLDINNCGLSTILIEPKRGMVVLAHNDLGHLPQALHTFL
jgi:serine/threonine-protein phosphatase PGAM5